MLKGLSVILVVVHMIVWFIFYLSGYPFTRSIPVAQAEALVVLSSILIFLTVFTVEYEVETEEEE